MKINKKFIKWEYVVSTIIILFFMIFSYRIFKNNIDDSFIPNFLIKKIVIEKPIEIKKEVVKYVEKDHIKTSDFIIYLNPKVDPIIAKEIGMNIDKYSKEFQLPKKLILGIIFKESSFNPFARSSVACGLMQIYPKYHQDKIKKLGITDLRELYHIDKNIKLGCMIFKEYFDQSKGNLEETFHKYLSKDATKKSRDSYMNSILSTWAKLEFMEFQKGQKLLPDPEIEDISAEEKRGH